MRSLLPAPSSPLLSHWVLDSSRHHWIVAECYRTYVEIVGKYLMFVSNPRRLMWRLGLSPNMHAMDRMDHGAPQLIP
jgi:hypothetical protein